MTAGEVRYVNGKRMASPEYRSWQAMKNRCLNPKARDYKRYGGRGIKIHPAWEASFEAFLADLGRRPTLEHTLERKDSNGHYEPGNCEWATRQMQARNRDYAATKSWLLAEKLGVKLMTAHHFIWQVRSKDKGDLKWFNLSPEREAVVREHLRSIET